MKFLAIKTHHDINEFRVNTVFKFDGTFPSLRGRGEKFIDIMYFEQLDNGEYPDTGKNVTVLAPQFLTLADGRYYILTHDGFVAVLPSP